MGEILLLHMAPFGGHDAFEKAVPTYGLLIENSLLKVFVVNLISLKRFMVVPAFGAADKSAFEFGTCVSLCQRSP